MAAPHLMLIGYGVTDTLQLTVEGQRALSRFGSAFTLGLPPVLAAFLKSQRVKVTDLAPELSGAAPAEGYLAVASRVLERTTVERPVILLSPGHPLIFNSIGRYLAAEGRRLGLTVQVVPGVSQLDLLIGAIGLDVTTFGLQVFDAARFVSRGLPVSPAVPVILMHAGALGVDSPPAADDLARRLQQCYPSAHPAVALHLGPAGLRAEATTIAQLPAVALGPNTHLFLDALRATPQGNPA